ncbi:CHAT domain-containing protein [Myxococcaceae bacterium GXIMD 01537]
MRTRLVAGAVLGLLLGLAALVLLRQRQAHADDELWRAREPARPGEFRLSHPRADAYRPYSPAKSAPERPLPLRGLAALEAARDLRGLAAVYLLRAQLSQAEDALDRAGAAPEVDSDRAALALSKGEPARALELLDGVLATVPRYPQALWNRGLALRALGLTMMAAESFEKVAALGEPGWSTEAREKADSLRAHVRERASTFTAAKQAGDALRLGGPVPLEAARAFPGILRLHFYDALRAAPTRERALELLPMATVLDAHEGKGLLAALVRDVAARGFARRAPLAREYDRLRREGRPPAEWQPLMDQARAAGERDILLGAFYFSRAIPSHLNEYTALAASTGDTWFALLAARQRALVEMDRGEFVAAERVLVDAVRICATSRLDFRCAELEDDLAYVYSVLHRLPDARHHAEAGLRRAHEASEWEMEQRLLQSLGQVARLERSVPLAAAWYGEVLARQPDPCQLGRHVHQDLAAMYQLALRPAEAREHLQRALQCGPVDRLSGAAVLAELARASTTLDEDARNLHGAAELLRGDASTSPGERLLLAHYEGRLELERDRERGLALLRRNLEDTASLARDDVNARKARTASYTSLLMDAGLARDFDGALALFAQEQGVAVPARCSLAVAVDDERTLLVARGPGGEVRGLHDTGRTQPFQDATGLVPEPLLAVLRPCEHVVVLARPPVHGHAGLLPPELAWSYHVGREAPRPKAPATPRHLVIADVVPPPGLNLPRLNTWAPAKPDARRSVLAGPAATPTRVLAEMADATEIEFHTHGLIDPEVSSASLVVLSPEPDGRYALTAREVRQQVLRGSPIVILAACRAAHTAPFLHEPFSLPVAFAEAGARAVFAATVDLPDSEVGPFFDAVRAHIREGAVPSVALRDERRKWLQRPGADWVRHVLVFE